MEYNIYRELHNCDEYLSFHNEEFTRPVHFMESSDMADGLARGFNSQGNIVTLLFTLLRLKGVITEKERINNVVFQSGINILENDSDIEEAMRATIEKVALLGHSNCADKDTVTDISNRLIVRDGISDEKLIKIKEYFQSNNTIVRDNLTIEYNELLSTYYSIKGCLENTVFLKLHFHTEDVDSYSFILLLNNNINNLTSVRSLGGYCSKVMIYIATTFFKWGLPSFPEKTEDFSTELNEVLEIAKKLNEDISQKNNLDIDITNSTGYEQIAKMLNELIDLTEINKAKLKKLSEYGYQSQMNTLKRDVELLEEKIQRWERELREFRVSKQKQQNLLFGLKYLPRENAEFDDFVDVLNAQCKDIEINNQTLSFSHFADLDYISGVADLEDMLESAYAEYDEEESILYRAVFIENKYKLKLYSHYYFDFESNIIRTDLRERPESECYQQPNAFPNPHHRWYDCLGGNEDEAQKNMIEGNLLGALCTIMYSTGAINISDDAVWDRFREQVSSLISGKYDTIKCFYDIEHDEYITATELIDRES